MNCNYQNLSIEKLKKLVHFKQELIKQKYKVNQSVILMLFETMQLIYQTICFFERMPLGYPQSQALMATVLSFFDLLTVNIITLARNRSS